MASESVSFARAIRTTESLLLRKSIFHENGNTGEIPREQMIAKLQGEVAKWNAADSTVKSDSGITLYSRYGSGIAGTAACMSCDVFLCVKTYNALVFLYSSRHHR
jgi:hypothetical protein